MSLPSSSNTTSTSKARLSSKVADQESV
ncbi:hypothetical protein E2C01_090280 [Portunus trituberculatus]|uniref:Uncharacterized protein n=1 Tax=Portunus trituberculatus TaxID=210409 RepID=A0A5B7JRT2_PORTR|nr:hypothetical protein [Portunus trituberculatus]